MHSQERPLLSNHKHDNTRPALSAEAFTQCIAALLGIVKGIVPGDTLNERDVLALNAWLCYHEELLDLWPANVIAERISEVLAERKMPGAEAKDLSNALTLVLNWGFVPPGRLDPLAADETMEPFQTVEIPGRSFLFSGQFLYGAHSRCEAAVLQRGGLADKTVGPSLDYLVLGSLPRSGAPGSEFPAVLKTARELRRRGDKISIVSEQAWHSALEAI